MRELRFGQYILYLPRAIVQCQWPRARKRLFGLRATQPTQREMKIKSWPHFLPFMEENFWNQLWKHNICTYSYAGIDHVAL